MDIYIIGCSYIKKIVFCELADRVKEVVLLVPFFLSVPLFRFSLSVYLLFIHLLHLRIVCLIKTLYIRPTQ